MPSLRRVPNFPHVAYPVSLIFLIIKEYSCFPIFGFWALPDMPWKAEVEYSSFMNYEYIIQIHEYPWTGALQKSAQKSFAVT
jgi:hypothetical protein